MRMLSRSLTRPLLCGAWLISSGCAALGPNVEILPPTDAASQPASEPVLSEMDFTPIPKGYCAPIDGIFVTLDGANALVYAQRKRDHEHKRQLLDLEERVALAESRADGAEKRAAELDSWWERSKFWIGLGAGALVTGAAVGVGAYIAKH